MLVEHGQCIVFVLIFEPQETDGSDTARSKTRMPAYCDFVTHSVPTKCWAICDSSAVCQQSVGDSGDPKFILLRFWST